jgi:triosephosphate isomerase
MKKEMFFIANWKMYLCVNDALQFATENYDELVILANIPDKKIVLCPSFTALYTLANIFKETMIQFGAQDCSEHNKGAFTGQICAKDLKAIGCHFCIIGHSELRHYKHETHEAIAKKLQHLIDQNISPIICIGENKSEYDQGLVFQVLSEQLNEVFSVIKNKKNKSDKLPICIAYEPVWSIGTGNIPDKTHLENIFAWLAIQCLKIGEANWKFLYGGSVNQETIYHFENITHLDGYLIGSASLDFQEFKKIVNCRSHYLTKSAH